MKSFLKYNWPSILWAVFILVASLLPTHNLPAVKLSDKLIHGSMYAFLFVITYLGWQYQQWKQLLQKQTIVLLVIGIPLFGFIIEIIQGTCTATRYFDWWDALANTLGAFVAILLIQLIKTFHFFEKL